MTTGVVIMHRYREFGLASDQDELLRRAFRDGFKGAGLSFSQLLDALGWYRDHVRAGIDEEQLVETFASFAADRGWPTGHCEAALDLYRAIRDNGPALAINGAPEPAADRAMLADGERLLRTDPARYWRDAELQDALFEARERLALVQADGDQAPRGSSADRARIAEIEAMLHDPSGAGQRRYWNDGGLRADYTQALARVMGEPETSESDGSELAAQKSPEVASDSTAQPIV